MPYASMFVLLPKIHPYLKKIKAIHSKFEIKEKDVIMGNGILVVTFSCHKVEWFFQYIYISII